MSEFAAIKLVRRVREMGSTAPARIGGYRKPLLAGHEDLLRELVAAKGTITLAEIQALLRSAAARTKEALWTTIGQLLNRFSPGECRNYLANSGYEFT